MQGIGACRWCLHHARVARRGEATSDRMLRLKRWPSRILALALVGVAIGIAAKLYPHPISVRHNPSLLDVFFDSRAVVLGVRIVFLFTGAFIVASLFARIWGRQWLSKAGPFEVSEAGNADLRDQVEKWQSQARDTATEITTLRDRLAEADAIFEELVDGLRTTDERATAAESEVALLSARVAASDGVIEELLAAIKASGGEA
jgi:hypothetical protein